jgi:hypothetical protein
MQRPQLPRTNMKTARFLFAILGFGAVTLGMGFADEPSKQPSGQEPSENHTTTDRPADQAHGHVQDRPKQLAKSREDSGEKRGDHTQAKRASVNDLQQPGLKRAATAANGGLVMNKIDNHHGQPARLPVGSGTTAPAPGVIRSRSATETAIGGLPSLSAKNSATGLNGTTIKRKP